MARVNAPAGSNDLKFHCKIRAAAWPGTEVTKEESVAPDLQLPGHWRENRLVVTRFAGQQGFTKRQPMHVAKLVSGKPACTCFATWANCDMQATARVCGKQNPSGKLVSAGLHE